MTKHKQQKQTPDIQALQKQICKKQAASTTKANMQKYATQSRQTCKNITNMKAIQQNTNP